MHPLFADWYRLALLKAEADTLGKRWEAVEGLKGCSVAEWLDAVRLFIGRSHKSVSSSASFIGRFKATDPLFPLLNNELEVQVLAGAALIHLFARPSVAADATALAVVCLDCRGKGEKGPLTAALPAAQKYLLDEGARMRRAGATPVAPAKKVQVTSDLFEDIEKISVPAAHNNWQTTDQNFATIQKWNNSLLQAVLAMNNVLAEVRAAVNAAPERSRAAAVSTELKALHEETDVLWWLFGERSRDLDLPFKEVQVPGACLVAAKELVDLTTILPGLVATRSVLGKALSNAGKVPAAVKLQDAVEKSPRPWREEWVESGGAGAVLDLAPVVRAVARSVEVDEGDDWTASYNRGSAVKANTSFSPIDLACQVYNEGLLARVHAAEA